MPKTFVVYAENKPDVLARIAMLFHRRAIHISSFCMVTTERPDVLLMAITTELDGAKAQLIVADLYKLVNVLLVENATHETANLAINSLGAKSGGDIVARRRDHPAETSSLKP